MITDTEINSSVYDELGERWYSAFDDPVALLRAQSRLIEPWVHARIEREGFPPSATKILDIGCGGGFLSNALGARGYAVTGIDRSRESLAVAARHDPSGKVRYETANAEALPFANATFDIVTCMDFLEHVEDPAAIISEASRVLKPGGLFLFHTFNRNFISGIVVIRFVEWFVKNAPKNLHLKRLFIKPAEIRSYLRRAGLVETDFTGIRPLWRTIDWKSLRSGWVPAKMAFTFTKGTRISYLGGARKLAH